MSMCNTWTSFLMLTLHEKYPDKVPPSVPANKALKAINLKKVEAFVLETRDPLPFGAPIDLEPTKDESNIASSNHSSVSNDISASNHSSSGDGNLPPPSYDLAMSNDSRLEGPGIERSDSDLARELSERLNGPSSEP